MTLEQTIECEATLHFTRGIQPTNKQSIETQKCDIEAHYSCVECIKPLCKYHSTADPKTGDIYCTNHYPGGKITHGLVLVKKP